MNGMYRCVEDTVISQIKKNINISPSAIELEDTIPSNKLPDSYQSLKVESSKNPWSKRLFSLLVQEPTPPDKIKENKSLIEDYRPYEGKIIRNISVKSLDPFGTDIRNPEAKVEGFNFFNNINVTTREQTVKNLLQFRRGDPVKPAIMAASEANIRNASYILDARVIIEPIPENEDFVDVKVIVRDKWTIGAEIHNLSSSKTNIEFFDKNILGTGSRVGLNFVYSSKYDRKFGFGGNYLYENVAKTNIDLEGNYLDEIRAHRLSMSASRKLQPKFNYFGEISYKNNIRRTDRYEWDSITPDRREEFSATLGRAFTLPSENSIRRFAIGLRYKNKSPEYRDKLYQEHVKDKLIPYKYVKNQLWLMQLSLYQTSYLREYLIYNFGTTENIAHGYNISTQFGYSKFDDYKNSMYGSLSASFGTSKMIQGNIYFNSSIASFFGNGKPYGGVLKLGVNYYTPLKRISNLRYRQFLSVSYGKLLHPDRYFGDRIYMGEHTSLQMRDWRNGRSGIEQLLVKSETDIFSNYEIAGFRLLFYNFFDMGWINPGGGIFKSDNFNYGMGLGIRIRNDFVILNTIDLKIGVYPKLDQSGFRSFFRVRSSTPNVSPNFTPGIPEEILLEY